MNFMKGLSNKRNTELQETESNVSQEPVEGKVEEEEKQPSIQMDSLDIKLQNVVREVIESRASFKEKLTEDDRIIHSRDAKIKELQHENEFLERKIENMSKELLQTEETVGDLKLQNEHIQNEYNAHRTQSENERQDLQDKLTERELANRQLMFDLNKSQQDSERKTRELESQIRDHQVKHQHLDEKYRKTLAENERLLSIINNFASEATSLTKSGKLSESS